MAQHTSQVLGILELDAVARGTQLRLCGRWAGIDASPQLVSRWITELEPLLELLADTDRDTADQPRLPAKRTVPVACVAPRGPDFCDDFENAAGYPPNRSERPSQNGLNEPPIRADLGRLHTELQAEYERQVT